MSWHHGFRHRKAQSPAEPRLASKPPDNHMNPIIKQLTGTSPLNVSLPWRAPSTLFPYGAAAYNDITSEQSTASHQRYRTVSIFRLSIPFLPKSSWDLISEKRAFASISNAESRFVYLQNIFAIRPSALIRICIQTVIFHTGTQIPFELLE